MSSFGARLRELRMREKLKQDELASLLNISKSAVSMYERDEREPSFQLIKQLADHFQVTTDDLLGYRHSLDEKQVFIGNQLSDDEVEYLRESLEVYRKMKRKTWYKVDE